LSWLSREWMTLLWSRSSVKSLAAPESRSRRRSISLRRRILPSELTLSSLNQSDLSCPRCFNIRAEEEYNLLSRGWSELER
jgi:hypothetical protein